MKLKLILPIFAFLLYSLQSDSFKNSQLKYSRVRAAYKLKDDIISKTLLENDLSPNNLRLYLRAFKSEQEIELWAKNAEDKVYNLIRTYDVCASSGGLGPKRKQGDRQVPEGFYHIDRFNPVSSYHLSLGINYPNTSDRILGTKNKLGGDIFIHGNCVTIGCLPLTDDIIKELYIYCVEAKNAGQNNIAVTIFPNKLSTDNYNKLLKAYPTNEANKSLWKELKEAYDYFNKNKSLPSIQFLRNGRHVIN